MSFDPSQPFEDLGAAPSSTGPPQFDPSQPFEDLGASPSASATPAPGAGADAGLTDALTGQPFTPMDQPSPGTGSDIGNAAVQGFSGTIGAAMQGISAINSSVGGEIGRAGADPVTGNRFSPPEPDAPFPDPRQSPLYRAGGAIASAGASAFPVEDENFGTGIARMAGAVPAYVGAALVGGPLAAGAVGGLSIAGSGTADAPATATPEQIAHQAAGDFVVGAAGTAIPVEAALAPILRAAPGLAGQIVAAVKSAIRSGVIGEHVQAAMQFATNLIARATVDPGRDPMQGVGEAAAGGAAFGLVGAARGAMAARAPLEGDVLPPEPPEPPPRGAPPGPIVDQPPGAPGGGLRRIGDGTQFQVGDFVTTRLNFNQIQAHPELAGLTGEVSHRYISPGGEPIVVVQGHPIPAAWLDYAPRPAAGAAASPDVVEPGLWGPGGAPAARGSVPVTGGSAGAPIPEPAVAPAAPFTPQPGQRIEVLFNDGSGATGIYQGKDGGHDTIAFENTPSNPESLRGKTITGPATRSFTVRPAEEPPPPAPQPPAPTLDQVLEDARPVAQIRAERQARAAAAAAERAPPLPEYPLGSAQNPIPINTAADLHGLTSEIDHEPSPGAKLAGNYSMGHGIWRGLPFTIETAQGHTRTAADGSWSATVAANYGYFRATTGADGDQVDAFFGNAPQSDRVFVVDQIDPRTGAYDEAKVLAAFPSQRQAIAAYTKSFSDGLGPARIGAVTPLTVAQLKGWLANGDTSKPLSYIPPPAAPPSNALSSGAPLPGAPPVPAPASGPEGAPGTAPALHPADIGTVTDVARHMRIALSPEQARAAAVRVARGEPIVKAIRAAIPPQSENEPIAPGGPVPAAGRLPKPAEIMRGTARGAAAGAQKPGQAVRAAAQRHGLELGTEEVRAAAKLVAQGRDPLAAIEATVLATAQSAQSEAAKEIEDAGPVAARRRSGPAQGRRNRPAAAPDRSQPGGGQAAQAQAPPHGAEPGEAGDRRLVPERQRPAGPAEPELRPSAAPAAERAPEPEPRAGGAPGRRDAGPVRVAAPVDRPPAQPNPKNEPIRQPATPGAVKSGSKYSESIPETRPRGRAPLDLLQFIASEGGIRDQGGELAARNARRFIPGYGPLVRPKGATLDDMTLRLWEAGYLGPFNSAQRAQGNVRPEINDMLDALDQALRGRKIYSEADEREVEERGAQHAAADERKGRADALRQAHAAAEKEGLAISNDEARDAARLIFEGADPWDAVVEAVERSEVAARDDAAQDAKAGDHDGWDIPFADPGAARGAGEGASPPREPATGPEGGEASGFPEGRGTPRENQSNPAPPSERTEAGEQGVIPGAERISDKALAERRMEGRKAAAKPQKAADEGLFDVAGRGQGDLLGPSYSRTETVGINADLKRLIDLFGPKMYSADLPQVTMKELVQNSFDGIKSAHAKGTLKAGEGTIKVQVDSAARTITVMDDGSGMSPDTMKSAFLTLAGTEKEGLALADRSGGFGVAKMAFIFGNDELHVVTTRDGVRSELRTTGKELLDGQATLTTGRTRDPNGTRVTVKLPKTYRDERSGDERTIYVPRAASGFAILERPLLGDVSVRDVPAGRDIAQDPGEELPLGRAQDMAATPKFTTAKFPWGAIDVYVGERKREFPSISALSSGLFQFSPFIAGGPSSFDRYPYDVILDVRAEVEPDSKYYPFTKQREDWNPAVKPDIGALVNYLQRLAAGREAENIGSDFLDVKLLPRVGAEPASRFDTLSAEDRNLFAPLGTDLRDALPKRASFISEAKPQVEIGDGEVRAGGKVLARDKENFTTDKTLNLGKDAFSVPNDAVPAELPLFHSNLSRDIVRAASERSGIGEARLYYVLARFATLAKDFQADLAKVPGYAEYADEPRVGGVALDKNYHGVFIRVPFQGFFLNPLSFDYRKSSALAEAMTHTLVHEATHTRESGHGEQFTIAMGRLYGDLAEANPGVLRRLDDNIRKLIEDHRDAFDALRDAYQDPATRNRGSAAPSQRESADGSRADRDRTAHNLEDGVPGQRASARGTPGRADRGQPGLAGATRDAGRRAEGRTPEDDRPGRRGSEPRRDTGESSAGLEPSFQRAPAQRGPTLRETSPGFYSALARGLEDVTLPKAPPAQWKGVIRNLASKGVKQEEVDWLGIIPWLDEQKSAVTKGAILDFVRENEVKVEEVEHSGDHAMFGKYTFPQGKNYREFVLIADTSRHRAKRAEIEDIYRRMAAAIGRDPEEVERLENQAADLSLARPAFRDAHFGEENAVAHFRTDDRTGREGQRILFMEENQSDLHEAGRRLGYTDPAKAWEVFDPRTAEILERHATRAEAAAASERLNATRSGAALVDYDRNPGVPDLPFKRTWHELVAKRALRLAAEEGYDVLAWTTGAQQAERYPAGDDEEKATRARGMEGFYDRILPQFFNSYAKKWGARVGETLIPVTLTDEFEAVNPAEDHNMLETVARFLGRKKPRGVPVLRVHSIDITPAMRASVMKGQPLFEQGGEGRSGEHRFIDETAQARAALKARRDRVAIRRYLMAKAADGFEHHVAVAKGKIISAGRSDSDDQTVLGPDAVREMSARGSDVALHHNHPRSWSLSPADISTLAFPGMQRVVAYGHDGSEFAATLGARGKIELDRYAGGAIDGREARLIELSYAARDAAKPILLRAALDGTITDIEAEHFLAHVVNAGLARADVIGYTAHFSDLAPTDAEPYVGAIAAATRAVHAKLVGGRGGGTTSPSQNNPSANRPDRSDRDLSEKDAGRSGAGQPVRSASDQGSRGQSELPAPSRRGEEAPSLTPQFLAKQARVAVDLDRRLKQYGLADRIGLGVMRDLTVGGREVSGQFDPAKRLVLVALQDSTGENRPALLFDHEAIHALRGLGLFTAPEWTALTEHVKRDKGLMAHVAAGWLGLGLTEEQLLEEAVAEGFAEHQYLKSLVGGVPLRAYNKIKNALAALRGAFADNGLPKASDVFEKVAAGEVGARAPVLREGGDEDKLYAPLPVSAEPGPILDPPPEMEDEHGTATRIDDALYRLRKWDTADKIEAEKFIKSAPKTWRDVEFQAKAFDEIEARMIDPAAPYSPDVKRFMESAEFKPWHDEQGDLVSRIRDMLAGDESGVSLPLSSEGYVHRVLKGGEPTLDELDPEKSAEHNPVGMGRPRTLSKEAAALHGRKFFVLEDDDGNRTFVPAERPKGMKTLKPSAGKSGLTWQPATDRDWRDEQQFRTADGKLLTARHATVKEIEAHTKFRYIKLAGLNTIENVLRLRRVARNLELLNELKPQLYDAGLWVPRGSQDRPPADFIDVTLPQLEGKANPSIAYVLNDFHGLIAQQGDPLEFLAKVNRFLVASLFFNPLPHASNVSVHWITDRGWDWLPLSGGYRSLVKHGMRAIKAVATLNGDYTRMLKEGSGLIYGDVHSQNFYSDMLKALAGEQLKHQREWGRIARMTGFASVADLVRWEYRAASKMLWAVSDVFMLQRQFELEGQGMKTREAIYDAERGIPNYRVPSEIPLGGNRYSRRLAKAMKNANVIAFGRYGYNLYRGLAAMLKDLTFSTVAEKKRALGKFIVLAIMAYAVHPQSLISWSLYPRGPLARIEAVWDAASGERGWLATVASLVTPAPALEIAHEMVTGKDTFGRDIASPGDSWPRWFLEITEGALKHVGPTESLLNLAKPNGPEREAMRQLGVKVPAPNIERAKIAAQKFQYRDAGKREQKDEAEQWLRGLFGAPKPNP